MADALFPRVRQRVLAILYGNPDRSFFASELMALAQSGRGAVQRELGDLTAAGLLTVTSQGNQKHYQANQSAPIFAELRSLILKTFGLADVLRNALAPLAGDIAAAFVFGSVAKQRDTASSDIDVMIVSDSLGYAEVFGALEPAAISVGPRLHRVPYPQPRGAAHCRLPAGESVHRVFQLLPHTLGLGPEVLRVLDKCHNTRNVGEYEGLLDVDARLVEDLVTATQAVATALAAKVGE
jgi:hypothetical protein